jgi:nucleoside-triphosphatase
MRATLRGDQGGSASGERMKTAYLVTGEPGIGKTTLIRQVVSTMRMRAAGFYTEDIRNQGQREGFRIVTLDGDMALLASSGHPGPVQVSKYGVDLRELERVAVPQVARAIERGHVAVVDEIGRMQLYSRPFRQLMFQAVHDGHPLLGTVMLGRNRYADKLKSHRNVEVLMLTEDSRNDILAYLRTRFV